MSELLRPGPDTIYHGMIAAVKSARQTDTNGDKILTVREFAGAEHVIEIRLSEAEKRIVWAVAQGFVAGAQRDTFMETFANHLFDKTWG